MKISKKIILGLLAIGFVVSTNSYSMNRACDDESTVKVQPGNRTCCVAKKTCSADSLQNVCLKSLAKTVLANLSNVEIVEDIYSCLEQHQEIFLEHLKGEAKKILWPKETNARFLEFQIINHKNIISLVKLTPDGNMIVFNDSTGTVNVWIRGVDGRFTKLQTLKGHKNGIVFFDVTPDGNMIVGGSNDGRIYEWVRGVDGKFTQPQMLTSYADFIRDIEGFFESQKNSITSLKVTPDRNMIVSGYFDGTVKVWRRIRESVNQ